jgi:citrate synthase
MEDPLFTDEKKAKYKKEADEKMKEAVDSLMNLILQLSPTSHSQPDMRGRVEAAVSAILDAAIAHLVQYNSEAPLMTRVMCIVNLISTCNNRTRSQVPISRPDIVR